MQHMQTASWRLFAKNHIATLSCEAEQPKHLTCYITHAHLNLIHFQENHILLYIYIDRVCVFDAFGHAVLWHFSIASCGWIAPRLLLVYARLRAHDHGWFTWPMWKMYRAAIERRRHRLDSAADGDRKYIAARCMCASTRNYY